MVAHNKAIHIRKKLFHYSFLQYRNYSDAGPSQLPLVLPIVLCELIRETIVGGDSQVKIETCEIPHGPVSELLRYMPLKLSFRPSGRCGIQVSECFKFLFFWCCFFVVYSMLIKINLFLRELSASKSVCNRLLFFMSRQKQKNGIVCDARIN